MKVAGILLMIMISYSVIITVYALMLRHRIATSKNWRLALSRKERRRYALEQMQREDDEYDAAQLERQSDQVKRFMTPDLSTHKEGNPVEIRP